MFKKGTKIYSVVNSKCPRCQEGSFFKHTFTFHPARVTQLYDHCPNCHLRYTMEPSFFFGAMYVNYGITVALSITTFTIATLLFNLIMLESFAAIIGVLLVLAPLNLRLSRIIWINMFVSYKEM